MDSKNDVIAGASKTPPTQVTLKRPVQIVKKRSGPLDEVLAELNKSETVCTATSTPSSPNQVKSTAASTQLGSHAKGTKVTRPSPTLTRRRSTLRDKEKKRERWLLTRKTWKYMTDAGRKLIPEGAQNRQEDVPKVEAHFQKVCASEPHFVLWRRKSSYPGAMRNSKKRLKQLLQHTAQVLDQEEISNCDIVLELLHSHLKLDEAIKTDTLLGTKTEGPHQTNSPSAQRLKPLTRSIRKTDQMNMSLRGPGFLPPPTTQLQQQSLVDQLLQRLLILSRSSMLPDTIDILPENINAELLNDKATLKKIYNALKKQQLHRILTKHSIPSKPRKNLTHSTSMLSLLHFNSNHPKPKTTTSTTDKTIKTKSAIVASVNSSIPSSSSTIASLTSDVTAVHHAHTDSAIQPVVPQRQRKPPTSLNLSGVSTSNRIHKDQEHQLEFLETQLNSCGTQTNFIPLSEIKRLAEDYREFKGEMMAGEAGEGAGGGNATTDDEGEKQATSYSHRRKSSIDNEDVSQSVSDTIKRYLRMARKKSIHDENANRFKRVNYDRNLRNIQAKGEINPPGMDEDNNKAVQTLDAWALITLDFIRGNETSGILETAHNDWQKSLDERIQRKLEYEQKNIQKYERQQQQRSSMVYQSTSSCSSSTPTSPTSIQSPTMTNRTSTWSSGSVCDVRPRMEHTSSGSVGTNDIVENSTGGENVTNMGGIFHSSSQFIANLWHGTTNSSNSFSPISVAITANNQKHDQLSPTSVNDCIDVNIASNNNMIKSKSLSHIGQYVQTKILKGHSKNQQKSSELLPLNAGNTSKVQKWSKSGKCSWSSESGEQILLCDCAFHILSDLEAKMVQKICLEKIIELNIEVDLNIFNEYKSHKRRLLKRAMTTSFFDVGKKNLNVADHNSLLFSNSLEECVINDKKREVSNLSASSSRGSRNSIVSLFRVGSSRGVKDSINSHKLNENVRSCENLPTGHETQCGNVKSDAKYTTITNYIGNMTKSASRRISRSQSDVRRGSHDHTDLSPHIRDNEDGAEIQIFKPQVPQFVITCINYLEENGLHKVGIFRVSTSKKRVKQMRENFDKNYDKSFDDNTCPHNVATLLKEFLRDLPEPLLPNGLYKAFLQTQKIRNRRLQLEAISHLVKLLPPAHRDTLYVLLKFLAKVAACSDDVIDSDGTVHLTGNKMDSNNLATVFAPNILRPTEKYKPSSKDYLNPSKEQESISDAINVIRTMIDHYEELFQVPADILDIIYTQLQDEDPDQLNNMCEYHKTRMLLNV